MLEGLTLTGMGAAAAAGILALMIVVLLLRSQTLAQRLLNLQSELKKKESVIKQQGRSLFQVQQDSTHLSRLVSALPDLAKQLSSVQTTQELEENIVSLTHQTLDAREVSLFTVDQDALVLKTHKGLSPKKAAAVQKVKLGEGPIGWTAKKRVVMTAEDFYGESNLAKEAFGQDRNHALQSDICAPLVHWDRFYGVINVGGMAASPEHGRRCMKLICNLGAIAMENVLLQREMQLQADLDSLTKLYNVTYFHKYMDREILKAQRYERPLTVIIFDLDHFDNYNRLLGRMEGDKVLCVVANIIKEGLRNVDIPCRYGGEEIAVVLPETDREKGLFVAERTRKAVEDYPFSPKRVTISGGLAVYPSNGKDSKGLMERAESALAQAQEKGRNRIVADSPDL